MLACIARRSCPWVANSIAYRLFTRRMKFPFSIFMLVIIAIGSVSCFAPSMAQQGRSVASASLCRDPSCVKSTYHSARKQSVLFLSTPDENSNDETSIAFRNGNERLTKRFHIGSILFGLVSAILFTMPDRSKAVQLASKYGGAAGYGLAAGTCRLVADAARNNRLSSDTYKRLNIGLFGFCFISFFSIPGEAAFHPQFGPAILLMMVMTFLKVWGCNLAFDGWKTGVHESNDNTSMTSKQLAKTFGKGVKSTVRSIFHTPRKGFVYLLYLMVVLAGGFSAVQEAQFYMSYNAPLLNISLEWSALARLFLISTMVFSLKDASERGRLTGSTFIQLNFMVGLWALFVAIGQGRYRSGFSFSKSPMLLMSVPFLYGGIRSLYQKSNAPPPPPKLNSPNSDTSPPQATSMGSSDLAAEMPPSQKDIDSDIPYAPSNMDKDTTSSPSEATSDSEADDADSPKQEDSDSNDDGGEETGDSQ